MKLYISLFLCFLASVLCPLIIHAHGTEYQLIHEGVVGVKAMFDTGVPMADSKVLVFRPGETSPCFQTVTDSKGIVCFRPDTPGTWILQVREKSGHGMRINLDIDKTLSISQGSSGPSGGTTYIQKLIMAVCVVWGFIGTALYFKRKKK